MDTFQLVKALIYPTTHIDVVLGKQLKLLQKIFINCEISFLSLSHLLFSVFVLPVRLFGEFRCTFFCTTGMWCIMLCMPQPHTQACVSCVYCCAFCLIPFSLSLSKF